MTEMFGKEEKVLILCRDNPIALRLVERMTTAHTGAFLFLTEEERDEFNHMSVFRI